MTTVTSSSVTGRDRYIIVNALAYAIEAMDRLPQRWQERSDQKDMIALLDAMSDQPDFFRIGARGPLQRRGRTLRPKRFTCRSRYSRRSRTITTPSTATTLRLTGASISRT